MQLRRRPKASTRWKGARQIRETELQCVSVKGLQLRFRVRLHADEIDPERRIPEVTHPSLESMCQVGSRCLWPWHVHDGLGQESGDMRSSPTWQTGAG